MYTNRYTRFEIAFSVQGNVKIILNGIWRTSVYVSLPLRVFTYVQNNCLVLTFGRGFWPNMQNS